MREFIAIGVSVLSFCQAGPAMAQESAAATETIPPVPREFRAAWVATVGNIDWPSRPGLPVDEQKKEAIAILDRLVELHMNAAVFQVRPQGDALYASKLEPWSSYLTGKQGQAPDPYYDPLEFWVSESHARGIELHAWFNPYRANHPGNKGGIADLSVVKSHPDWVVKLGDDGYYWMVPTMEVVRNHTLEVILDVVRRYDVDGVHFDDYFYPYRSYNDDKDFPDEEGWKAYQATGGTMSRNDWRRDSVNSLVRRLKEEIVKIKPAVHLGISPFGIWRPGHPSSIQGLDQYDVLYADPKLWLNEGWVDYLTPQLYWPIAQIPQSFPVLLGWWESENTKDRHLWPGTSLGRARRQGGEVEILNQIMITRGMTPESPGLCMFSMKSLLNRSNPLGEELIATVYAPDALIPASPWLDDKPPAMPTVSAKKEGSSVVVEWKPTGDEAAGWWVVQVQRGSKWSHQVVPGDRRRVELALEGGPIAKVAVAAVDRCRNQGPYGLASVK